MVELEWGGFYKHRGEGILFIQSSLGTHHDRHIICSRYSLLSNETDLRGRCLIQLAGPISSPPTMCLFISQRIPSNIVLTSSFFSTSAKHPASISFTTKSVTPPRHLPLLHHRHRNTIPYSSPPTPALGYNISYPMAHPPHLQCSGCRFVLYTQAKGWVGLDVR